MKFCNAKIYLYCNANFSRITVEQGCVLYVYLLLFLGVCSHPNTCIILLNSDTSSVGNPVCNTHTGAADSPRHGWHGLPSKSLLQQLPVQC